jgi:hypothetical protein
MAAEARRTSAGFVALVAKRLATAAADEGPEAGT